MDKLINKSYGSFDYLCRYTGVPYYYNTEDQKYIFGIGSNLQKTTSYFTHEVKETDTLNSLALEYYSNPTLYWVIAYFNDIQDAFINLKEHFDTIKIPQVVGIKFGEER